MKVKLAWIILVVALVSIAGIVVPRLKYWGPSSGPSASEPARTEQATPEATVGTVFQMTDQGGESDNPNDVITDRLNYAHMFEGKTMSPDEQKFADLFWDNQRSAAIYGYLRRGLTTSASITANNITGDSAVVSVAMKITPNHHAEWVDSTCTVELKKRGSNWYVDELKSERAPDGVFQKFKQATGSTP